MESPTISKTHTVQYMCCVVQVIQELPYKTLRTMYSAFTDSVITYGLSSYGSTYKTYQEDIYNLQITLLKTIAHVKIINM